jgi:predicted Zn-dependent protease
VRFVPKPLAGAADASRGTISWQTYVRNVASVVIVLGLGYMALGALAELLARTIPDRWEARMFGPPGAAVADPDTDRLARADEILAKLRSSNELRDLPYRLVLVPDSQPNAFAFPGGAIGVTTGLLDSVESEPGLAMVLAHELGHHQYRHTLAAVGRVLVFTVARALLFSGSDTPLVDASLGIAESGHSRRKERAADELGLRLVYQTYGHTEGSLELYEELLDRDADTHHWAAFLRSHPLTASRLDSLRRLQAQLEAGETAAE